MTDIKKLFLETAETLRELPYCGQRDHLADKLEAAAQSMGEPVLICRDNGHVNWWLRTGEQCTCVKVRPAVDLYLAPPPTAVHPGWREAIQRVRDNVCPGGDGAGMHSERDIAGAYLDAVEEELAMLVAPEQPKPAVPARVVRDLMWWLESALKPAMPNDCNPYLVAGWVHAYLCSAMDDGIDPRQVEVPAMVAKMEAQIPALSAEMEGAEQPKAGAVRSADRVGAIFLRMVCEQDYECHPDKIDAVNLLFDDLNEIIGDAIERAKEWDRE